MLSPGRGGTDPAFPPVLGTRGREGLFPRTVRVEGRSCERGWCMMLDDGISGGFPCVSSPPPWLIFFSPTMSALPSHAAVTSHPGRNKLGLWEIQAFSLKSELNKVVVFLVCVVFCVCGVVPFFFFFPPVVLVCL